MAYPINTDVAIRLLYGETDVTTRIGALNDAILIPVVIRVELEGSLWRVAAEGPIRRARLDVVLKAIPTLAFDDAAADV